MSQPTSPEARFWNRRSAAIRRRVNLGWWLEILGPALLFFGVVTGCAVMYLRSTLWFEPGDERIQQFALAAGGLVGLIFLVSWMVARRRFLNQAQAMVRLESRLRLDNALTAASLGLAPWPTVPEQVKLQGADGWLWNWPRLLLPPVFTAILVAVPFLLPVRPAQGVQVRPHEPMAWQEMEKWLDQLKEEKIADPEKVEEVAKQIDALRQNPPEDWFNHSNLEATDSLRESLERSLSELERNTGEAGMTLSAMAKFGNEMSAESADRLSKEFSEALQGLETGSMPLNNEMLSEMLKLGPDGLKKLDPQAAQKLAQKLAQNQEALKRMLSQCKNPGKGKDGPLSEEDIMKMLGEIPGEGEGMGFGKGGVSRGRGDAPMYHEDEESNLGTKKIEKVGNDDLTRAAPGDVLGVIETNQEIEKTATTLKGGGSVDTAGKGGGRVWESDLLPSEKAVLNRFYK
jgi:hypothetical protein